MARLSVRLEDGRVIILRDYSHAEQRVAQMLEEEFPDYAHIKSVSEAAFWCLVYGMSFRRAYATHLRHHADEEGCSIIFQEVLREDA